MIQNAPSLLSVAVREAPHPASQSEVCEFVTSAFAAAPDPGERFDVQGHAAVFANAGIERRTFALPLDAYFGALDASNRNEHYLRTATSLLADAAARAVARDLREAVTHVVTVSNSGVATPSLDCAVMQDLGFSPRARRVPVFGLGCAGGVAGLALAADLARSRPDALVLVLCAEITSLTLLPGDASLRNFVACALFGDGAAAALVAAPGFESASAPPRARLGATSTELFADTADLMGWDVRAEGWGVVFSPRIPGVVARNVGRLLGELGGPDAFAHFLLHPGGARILDAYRSALGLSDEQLAPATDVLRDHGNMSAATVFFVLDRVLRSNPRPGPAIATAFGPGFTADLLRMELLPHEELLPGGEFLPDGERAGG